MIGIPDWMKAMNPVTANFCELINMALEMNPNMSLAEFARQLDEENKAQTYRRIVEAERKQFGEERYERHGN